MNNNESKKNKYYYPNYCNNIYSKDNKSFCSTNCNSPLKPLFEVEGFLCNLKKIGKCINLYKFFK